MSHPLHHLNRRKRIHVKHEEYPHPSQWKQLLDRTVFFFGVAGPLMTFPQVWDIWITKSAANTSSLTWATYFLASVVWTAYGITHKEIPIIVSQGLYIVGTGLVLIGIAIF